jgi:hypothetical protein
MSDNDELSSIPMFVHLRILNLSLTQFSLPRQMCWQAEGNELRNGRVVDSVLFCLRMLSLEVIDGMVAVLWEQVAS